MRATAVIVAFALPGTMLAHAQTAPRRGGKLLPGIYAGDRLYGQKVSKPGLKLYLYTDNLYQLFKQNGRPVSRFGRPFRYDPASGKLDLEHGGAESLENEGDQAYCVFGYDADGKPYVEGFRRGSFASTTTRLNYVGPLDRLSPQQEAEHKKQEEEESRRYKFVVPTGQGLSLNKLDSIWRTARPKYDGLGGARWDEEVFLLLKDGTAYSGFPCPLDMWDISSSRRREPEKWGRWRRSGSTLSLAWRDAPNEFRETQALRVSPGKPGETLSGNFGASSASGGLIAPGGGSVEFRNVTFTSERFTLEKRGSFSSSIGMQSASGVAVFGADRAARAGTYTLDGYTLTLKFDDGRVFRQPFFFGKDRSEIWFQEETKRKK
jgi:hypothetical protein